MKAPAAAAPPDRGARTDGEATRARILEAAGELFAERGYSDTTSKAICERAGTNVAAVNYHFESRDGLYLAVLQEVHRRLISLDFLHDLARAKRPPREKLGQLLDTLVPALLDEKSWPTRLWARELLSPSPLLSKVMREQLMPKFGVLTGIMSEVTGLAPQNPALTRCVLSMMAPCMVLLIVNRNIDSPIRTIFRHAPADVAEHMKTFVFAGLEAIAAKYKKT